MIRHLKVEEIPLCISGGCSFFKEADLPGGFKAQVFCQTWMKLVGSGTGTIIGLFDDKQPGKIMAGLGAVLAPDLNNGDIVGIECFWYVLPEYRGGIGAVRLLKEFERWSRRHGSKRAAMIHLTNINQGLALTYRRMGYKEAEIHYVKDL